MRKVVGPAGRQNCADILIAIISRVTSGIASDGDIGAIADRVIIKMPVFTISRNSPPLMGGVRGG